MASPELLKSLYVDQQMPISRIAKSLNMDHRKAKRLLLEAGVVLRTMSEEKTIHASLMSYDDRLAMSAASRAIITGRKRSHSDLCQRARTKQDKAKMSDEELVILDAMTASGLHPIPQLAIDKFNIDFGFPDSMIAVEYHGGTWHNLAKKRAQDERKRITLESLGWRVMVFPMLRKEKYRSGPCIELSELVNQVHDAITPR